MRSAAPPPSPTPPAAELCQVCEQPARASVGHGEPPPPPPPPLPPRARLSAERGSELFPRLGRAWLLRRKGMTDPLRRTLSRLRGRRGPRAAGGHGLRAAAAATVAASSATEGDAGGAPDGPPGERASGAQPSLERPPLSPQAWGPEARVPGGRPERSGALGPRPRGGREAAPPGRGLTRASLHAPPRSEGSGEDEEDDAGEDDADYYENLPGGSQPAPEPEGAEAERWPPPPPAVGSSPGAEGGRLETGRLQTQLREAYYLLIQAMHDLPPDSGARRGDRGRADRGCPAGAWAPGQPPSPCGAADGRACPRDWERGGGGRPWQQVSPPRSPPRESAGGRPLTPRMRLFCSRSLDSLQVGAKPAPLQRWRSDSWIRCGARGDPDEPPPRGGGMDGWSGGSSRAAAPSGLRTPSSEDPGCSPGSRGKGDGQEGLPFLKPPAVTVKKLQKWMYKGRLLSLGMKGRARRTAPEVAGAQATSPHLGALNMQESQVVSVPPDHRITLTDLFENVYESSMKRRELEDLKDNIGFRGQKPLNSITVSKKRNWLYQSTLRSFNLEEENKKCQDMSHLSIAPISLPKQQLSRPFLKSSEEYYTCMVCNAASSSLSRNCSLDFNEENDADDEGEIWYNPIPEDDAFGISNALSFGEADSDVLKFPGVSLRMLSGSDVMKAEQHTEDSLCSSEHTGDVQTTQSSEINLVDSICSTDFVQQYKQRRGHKTQEGIIVQESPMLKSPFAGPGIVAATNKTDLGVIEPSSPGPSPVKKGSSINWSFPDKIKSPRTVRKLSMKMKRLPELSRKLSVKGTLNYANSPDNTSSLSKCNYHEIHRAVILPSGSTTTAAKRNVISLYHLDTSVSSQHSYQKKTSVNSKYSCKGGYLSDGDSPELVAKSSKHGSENKLTKGKEIIPNSCSKNEIDIDAFRHYSFSDQPKCSQYISGLMSVHFYGAEDLKPPRIDSKDVFCAIQVDSVNKARTALLTCRTTFLDMDHTFNIEIENAQHLKLVVFSWEPTPRKNRVCCHGTVVLPTLFRVTKTHQLAVKLEPRGLIYVKVTLLEQWENSLHGLDINREPVIFGVDIRKVVEKENIGLMVPLLIQKCIMEIEKRGCQVVGLYRLCGSAAVKKELREAFERDSKAVGLCESQYPDINVITGVLKDYLRELPSPLITKQLYEAVLDAMAKNPLKMSSSGCENDPSDSKYTVDLLGCLPDVEKATLMMLLDHLKLVASYHDVNKMTCQNLAVCFGPVLLSQRQETSTHNNRVFTDSEELASALDFKKHIEVLHYLLQLWPVKGSMTGETLINGE
ncbi:rho GTPase-activating protein SYDE2 isoform X2 [Hippopotamus amphibius kiboko]|uniref:rho GTPase-activating protein SYDE2 isoform X2 n=1 Tax=Hippopotamus amphibius kiboko TaxID=575201 RepID=UPI0025951E32|nr:rho GTPase-activating protein SYDE2 isoform X2 [Hippopotamus amphibius kiboko]XP_057570520.1 rho GTPase-activating protein SYDE2 isoform X2 [Hippopotamus amphibius kiboko]